jgi:hypothetical protein
MSWNSLVGLVSALRVGRLVRFPTGAGSYSFLESGARPSLRPIRLSVEWVAGSLYARIKRLGPAAGHSSSCSAEGDSKWSCTFISPYGFMACTERTLRLPKKDDTFVRPKQ